MQFILVPSWGFDFGDATYYGWRGFVQIGPVVILYWKWEDRL